MDVAKQQLQRFIGCIRCGIKSNSFVTFVNILAIPWNFEHCFIQSTHIHRLSCGSVNICIRPAAVNC